MMRKLAPEAEAAKSHSWLLGWLVFLLLAGYAVDAPLRYGLSFIHLESLVYLRDVFFVVVVGLCVVRWMVGNAARFPLVVTLYLLGAHFFFGVLNLQSVIQPLMGLKVLMAFVFGVAAFSVLDSSPKRVVVGAWILFSVTVAGVLINYFVVYPWAGAVLDSGIGQATLTREWTAGGVRRLAGFSRASFDAASIILVVLPIVLFSLRKNHIFACVVFLIALLATALTTSKGALLAEAVFVVWVFARTLWGGALADRLFIWCSALLTTIFPLVSVLANVRAWVNRNDLVSWWFSSFHERMYRMWPDALSNVTNGGSVLLGRGLGGVGFPQYFGEASTYNSADNVSVYMYVAFGLPGLLYMGILVYACSVVRNVHNSELIRFTCAAWAMFFMLYGLTTNMLEQPFFCVALGAAVGLGLAGGAGKPLRVTGKVGVVAFAPRG